MTPLQTKILEEFDEKFTYNYDTLHEPPCNVIDFKGEATPEEIKSFLLQALNTVRNEAIEEVIKALPQKKKETASGFDWALHSEEAKQATENIGFNKALKEILTSLETLKNL